ncbi:MAG TPA: hypothetical protein VLA74_09680 [Nitrososphaeraceae archaeon]|nr:hypothetical protein [Nitrososphaeraceae archaeon]
MQNSAIDRCTGTTTQCTFVGSNFANIYGGSGNYANQINSKTSDCSYGSGCNIISQNSLKIIQSQSSGITQTSDSNNICNDSICLTAIQNEALIGNSDNSQITQTVFQQNKCLADSNCDIVGSLSASIDGGADNQVVTQQLSQQNYCFINSICYIEGSVPSTGGSNTQINICILGSDCSNNHPDSQLIAIGSVCSTDGSGIKICTPYGIYTVPLIESGQEQQNNQNSQNLQENNLNSIETNDNTNNNNEGNQTGLQFQFVTNSPGSTSIQKGTNLAENVNNLPPDDPTISQNIGTYQNFEQIQLVAYSPNTYNEQEMANKVSNIFNGNRQNTLQNSQGEQDVSQLQTIINSQGTQSIQKGSNNIQNSADGFYPLGVEQTVEGIQEILQKQLIENSLNTYQTETASNQKNNIIVSNGLSTKSFQQLTGNQGINQVQNSVNGVGSIQTLLDSNLLNNKID